MDKNHVLALIFANSLEFTKLKYMVKKLQIGTAHYYHLLAITPLNFVVMLKLLIPMIYYKIPYLATWLNAMAIII